MKSWPAILFLALLLSGCAEVNKEITPQPAVAEEDETLSVAEFCIKACEGAKAEGRTLEHGPCLLNPMPINTDWVCDVAHYPRQQVDNRIEYQCSAFRGGAASHFVEVNPECKLIKKV